MKVSLKRAKSINIPTKIWTNRQGICGNTGCLLLKQEDKDNKCSTARL